MPATRPRPRCARPGRHSAGRENGASLRPARRVRPRPSEHRARERRRPGRSGCGGRELRTAWSSAASTFASASRPGVAVSRSSPRCQQPVAKVTRAADERRGESHRRRNSPGSGGRLDGASGLDERGDGHPSARCGAGKRVCRPAPSARARGGVLMCRQSASRVVLNRRDAVRGPPLQSSEVRR